MASLPGLPTWFGTLGLRSVSVHYFPQGADARTKRETSAFEVIVSAWAPEGGIARLERIEVLPPGGSGLPQAPSSKAIGVAPEDWIKNALKTFDLPEPLTFINPVEISGHFSYSTSRQLLTGHLLALRFAEILNARHLLTGEKVKFSIPKNPDESVIEVTARLYEELSLWGESTPAWIIKELEGVSINTIYNRLNVARSKKLIEKPGKGSRKSQG